MVDIEKPFLKWVGGKSQIIDNIIENFPKHMTNYHDIFLGGGSTLLALLSHVKDGKIIVDDKIYAYDLNSTLINTYKNIQKFPEKVYKKIKHYVKEFMDCEEKKGNRKPKTIEEAKESRESYYYWIRDKYNNLTEEERNDIIGTAMFIFLNKTCFRGVYRTGPHGFNVPYGHYKNPNVINKKTIMRVSELIKDVVFNASDFATSLNNVEKGDFAYLDPPYAPEKETSFVKYNADGFNKEQHTKLFDMCDKMRKQKIMFVMSNANVELVTNAFPTSKYTVEEIECRRAINSKDPSKKTTEVIIKSF